MISDTFEAAGFLLVAFAARTLFGDGVAEAVLGVECVVVGMALDGVSVNFDRVRSIFRRKADEGDT